ncbi:MAG: hypothetical protein KC649_05950, partial [Candidatus Omnitrophica bacterium]|nr:hypothetical protein [Candidatus Omnitrophota bacterium]
MTKSNSKIQDLIVQFDSSTALMKSLSLCLMRKEFKGVGVFKHENRVIAHLINSVPKTLRKGLYSWSGWLDAAAPDDARKISSAELSEWSLNYFKESSYPGVMYGSSNGAAVHLAAALGVPWIPQTYLFAVQRMMRPDAVNEDIEWGKKV